PSASGRAILVGTLKQLKLESPKLSAKFSATGKSRKEAFIIKSSTDRLILTAETELGVSHAVFALLEKLGCRWFFPTKTWTVIPRKNKFAITADIFDYPKIPSRSIWYQWGFIHDEANGYKKSMQDYYDWARHNRMASSFKTSIGHIWPKIYRENKVEFDAHPEYFLWNVKKKRFETAKVNRGIKIDTFHPGVEKIFKKYVLAYFKKHPNADMVGTGPSDGYMTGLISKTNPKATPSDIAFHGSNVAAKALKEAAKTNPLYKNKFVGQYAYADYSDPPTFPLEDNVYIELTGGFIHGKLSYSELLKVWPKYVKQMGFYRYYSVFQWNHDTLPGGEGANVVQIRKIIPSLYHEQHAVSICCESGNNWGLHGRGYYLANKLMLNPDANADAILEDFYSKAFGPAANVMKKYYEMFDPGNDPFICQNLLGQGAELIRKAGEMTKDNPEISARIDDLKVFWGYVMYRWNYEKASLTKDKAAILAAVRDLCTHAYRSRFRYMNHWEAIRQQWLGGGGLKLPEWKNPKTAHWKGLPDYDKKGVEQLFEKVREVFPFQKIKIKNFSNDLVPISLPKSKNTVVKQECGIWQGRHMMWMYSFGEPLEITIQPNLTGSKKATICTLKNRDGKILTIERRKPNKQICKFIFKVPKPGLYQVFIDNRFWRLCDYNTTTPMVIPTKKNYLHHGWQTPTCFYVPRGTKNLILIGYFSNDCNIFTDNWTHIVGKIKKSKNGEIQSIPVPEGKDGCIWSFANVCVNKLWFINAPNYLGYSPYGMMVPKELVEKDGLTVREVGE
ncbi:MAG: DUF4838 domain-containing protein, partial [Calditrichaeota bacterium]